MFYKSTTLIFDLLSSYLIVSAMTCMNTFISYNYNILILLFSFYQDVTYQIPNVAHRRISKGKSMLSKQAMMGYSYMFLLNYRMVFFFTVITGRSIARHLLSLTSGAMYIDVPPKSVFFSFHTKAQPQSMSLTFNE